MTTLEAQKVRLLSELVEAEQQLLMMRQQTTPNFKMINHYADLVVRNRELIHMIDTHLQLMPPVRERGPRQTSA